jgi:kynurenine formamidase
MTMELSAMAESTTASMEQQSIGALGHSLWPLVAHLRHHTKFVDLTHAFKPGQPRFPTLPDERRSVVYNYKERGVLVHRHEIVGQWGTHIDPPSHYIEGARTLDQLPVSDMLCPLAILDITERVGSDPDTVPSVEDVERYEARYGAIPQGAFVALRTGWHRRWGSGVGFQNRDRGGIARTPGWSLPVLSLLIEGRGITAVGHETLDTDPGRAWSTGDNSLERYVLGKDCWQIEGLADLSQVPEHGAAILVGWPKPEGGSGFPARAVAICPASQPSTSYSERS